MAHLVSDWLIETAMEQLELHTSRMLEAELPPPDEFKRLTEEHMLAQGIPGRAKYNEETRTITFAPHQSIPCVSTSFSFSVPPRPADND